MLAVLPIACFLAILLVLRQFHAVAGWRGAFLLTSVIWGLVLTFMTEALSLLRWIAFWPVLGGWALALVMLSWLLAIGTKQRLDLGPHLNLLRLSRFEIALLLGVSLILVAVGVIAAVAPPNSWDSMTYHMSRVVHWVQNKSVAHYPTHIPRQLYMNPWSEFAILHFQVLSRGDHLANFVEWASMVGSVVGVSLVAKELNADSRGQIFAAIVCATIPMGILQGSSTQTDYVVSFWLVCFVYFAMVLRTKPRWLYASAAGAALGLAILTKATAYLYAFPFAAWVGASFIRACRARGVLLVALALTVALVTNVGHYARNYDLYGNPLGPGGEGPGEAYANDVFTFSAMASNVVRNVGLHIGTPSGRVNRASTRLIYALHRLIGISPTDPRTTWERKEFQVRPPSFHESTAGNPVHLVLIIASVLVYFLSRHGKRGSGPYILSVGLGFLLFCSYLRWQPWHSRLHLPFFVLSAPFSGLIVGDHVRNRPIANACMVALILMALPWVFENKSRPLVGRHSIFTISRINQYVRDRGGVAAPYIHAAQMLSRFHCHDVGLLLGRDDYEYPFWALLREQGNETPWLEHVNVTNGSQKKYDRENHPGESKPCGIFAVSHDVPPSTVSVGVVVYFREWSARLLDARGGFASVYTRSSIP
jgi:hypothetical protein